ncbi:MAG TPA: protein kinase [Pirellulales bacterium]|jgi:tetratricopeptide (TPR) repeat protein|nr:protein kinase [Pirellulales bacterium]
MSENPNTAGLPTCAADEGGARDGHPGDEVLRAFALGSLPEAELEQVAQHLAGCDACRDHVEKIPGDSLTELVRGAEPEKRVPLRLQAGYEILQMVGRGGMGVVYRARQVDLDRIVALKQISGDVGADDLARFRAEASAMARLKHPNILQVYDVGEQDARPYLACEFVDGGLDRCLTGEPLPFRSACRLVAMLARAVQAAHDQGVIHRDLKPSNVLLVCPQEGCASPGDERFWDQVVPKIGDFGLAKLLDEDQGCTRTGALVGTPAYMAPEQAGGRGDEVGPRTDVYALGVIFYETLTGRRPFQGSTITETLDLVRTAEPVPPRRYRAGLPRDADTISLKCLEKEPRHRYTTAAELADDLERLLAGEPIRARPVPLAERAVKWVRRRPAWAALIAIGALAVSAGVAGTTWHVHRLRAEVERANKSEAEAMLNFRQGYEALDQVIRELAAASARSPAWRELNDRIWTKSLGYFYGALKDADESNPDVRLAKGMLLSYAGSVHAIQGRHARALEDLALSRQQLESCQRQRPHDLEARYHLANCFFWMGMAQYGLERAGEAEPLYRQAIDMESDLLAAGATFERLRHRLAQAHDALAWLYLQTGRAESAGQEYEASLAVRREIAAQKPLDNENRALFGEAVNQLVWLYLQKSQRDRAEECLREAVQVAGDDASQSLGIKATLAEVHRRWALLEFEREQIDRAIEHCGLAVAKLRDIQSQDPREPSAANLAATIRLKAWCLSRAGRADEAFAAWSEAIEEAIGAERDFYRSERALERAIVGAHAAAAAEADQIASHADLPAHQLVHLARIYSRSIEAVDRERQAPVGEADQIKAEYAAHAMACLGRVETEWFATPDRLAELETDVQLAALRATPDYEAWRASLPK